MLQSWNGVINLVSNYKLVRHNPSNRMELHQYFNNNLTKHIFSFWWAIGRFIGLLPIRYDKNLKKYVQSKPARFYTMTMGVIFLVSFPICSFRFTSANLISGKASNNFLDKVATFSQALYYPYVLWVYFIFSFKSQEFSDVINETVAIIEFIQENCHKYEVKIKKFEFLIFFCFAQQMLKVSEFLVTTYYVIDMNHLSFIDLAVLCIPETTSAILYPEFLLGILLLWKNGEAIRSYIENISKRQKIQDLQHDLAMSDDLDQLAISYNQLYSVYTKFINFYSKFILAMLFDMFHHLTLMTFYLVLWIIDYTYDLLKEVTYDLLFIGTLIILILLVNLFLFCQTSANCDSEVRFFQMHQFNNIFNLI